MRVLPAADAVDAVPAATGVVELVPTSEAMRPLPRRRPACGAREQRRAVSPARGERIAAANYPGSVTGFPPDNSFRPRRWLRGPHFQTILSSLPPRRSRVERRAIPVRAASVERLIECGDGVTLQAFHASPAKRGREPGKRVAVLLHGWEGSADSTYVLSMSQTLFSLGFEVVRLNLRDHGTTHHLNRELFHSCRLPEVVGAVRTLAQQFRRPADGARGFLAGRQFHAARRRAPRSP